MFAHGAQLPVLFAYNIFQSSAFINANKEFFCRGIQSCH